MKLQLVPRLEQKQILAPQMRLSMEILLLNSMDLENRIEKEFMENPALELAEQDAPQTDTAETADADDGGNDTEVQELFEVLDSIEKRYGGDEPVTRRASDAIDSKHEALQNHADRPRTLVDHLEQQIRFRDLDPIMERICTQLAGNVDARGYLMGDLSEIALSMSISEELAARALEVLQGLDPLGVAARDLRECLLIQLGDEEDSLERLIIEDHLDDLLQNRLPKIAESLEVTLHDVKEAVELISLLNPNPGSAFDVNENTVAVPEIFLDEVEGKLKVRIEEGVLPKLRISPACSIMLKEQGHNPKVVQFVKRKVEAARWLIHAIDQRRRTLKDIAQAIVDHQEPFLRHGPGNLQALTMQTIADEVRVHISTVSRATNGKYIETDFGVIELRRFFTGGVERADGKIESRDNVCRVIRELIENEDTRRPLSDALLTKKLQERGLDIARRTVTKYRERAGIAPSRLRKKY